MDEIDLPDPGEPLIDREYITVPSNKEAIESVVRTRRTLKELPAPPDQMNPIAVVMYYDMMNVNQNEIVVATGLTADQVKDIQMSEAYTLAKEDMVQFALDVEQSTVRGMLSNNALGAAQQIVTIALTAKSDMNRLNASKDLLDRAGHRPVDVVEHQHKLDGDLTINIIRKDESKTPPMIDITPKEF